jgi:hypothetical protein
LGYSQSPRIATIVKNDLIETNGDDVGEYPELSFVLVSNVNKPNGGILMRLEPLRGIPFVGITFDGATRTDSPLVNDNEYALPTKDITFRHDGLSDFPVRLLNVIALANAAAGIAYDHGTYPALDSPDLQYQGTEGDTDYYIIVPELVPLLRPLEQAGVPKAILVMVNEPLLVVIEDAYERKASPGEPIPAQLSLIGDPVALVVNVVRSIPVGIDEGFEELGLGRPLNTEPSGPYGVGGPPLPEPPPGKESAALQEELRALNNQTDDAGMLARSSEPITAEPDPIVTEPVVEKNDDTTEKVDSTKSTKKDELEDKTPEVDSTPPARKPHPLRSIVRDSFDASTPDLKESRPSGDRPWRKALKASTGQPPEADDTPQENPNPDPGQDDKTADVA